jgi:hypothetical protein
MVRFPVFMFIFLPLYHVGWLISRLSLSLPDFDKRKGAWYFFSLFKAYIEFMRKLKIVFNKRYLIRELRKTSDEKIFANTASNIL